MGDLAPTGAGPQNSQLLRTINIEIVTFEIAGEKLGELDTVWELLGTEDVKFNDAVAFASNSFRLGAGRGNALQRTVDLLDAAKATKLETTALLIPNGQTEVLNVCRLRKKQDVSFISRNGSQQQANIGPGMLGLQILASKVMGARALCNLYAVPIFAPRTEGLPPQLASRLSAKQFHFTPLGFGLTARPGDFVLLAPTEFPDEENALARLFFPQTANESTVGVFLLICTRVL